MLAAAILAIRLNLVSLDRPDTGRFARPMAVIAQHPRRPGAALPDGAETSAMTEGYVIEVLPIGGSKVRLWCMNRFDEACVFIPKIRGRLPGLGDKVWWQDAFLFWSSADGEHTNVMIRKLGEAFTPGRETFQADPGSRLRPVAE